MPQKQNEQAEILCKSLSKCTECSNNVPFFFEINGQKVMVITGAGTLQSAFFPLITVRFVRNLLYSLLGISGITEIGFRKLFEPDGIYWTSFYKCYDRHFLRTVDGKYAMDEFESEKCAKKFLQREIDLVKPELLIILGKAVCSEIRKLVEIKQLRLPSNVYFSEYFHLEEDISKIEEIRRSIARILQIDEPKDRFSHNAATTNKNNSAVHLQFQLCAARALSISQGGNLHTTFRPEYENEVEQRWIEQVATPIFNRYYIFLNYWSALESSSESFLCNNNDPSNLNPSNPQFKSLFYNADKPLLHNMKEMRDEWREKLTNYYKLRREAPLLKEWQSINDKLNVLKEIRNSIVHSMGFVPFKTVFLFDAEYSSYFDINKRLRTNGFSGISIITNMVYISEKGLSEMDELFAQLVKLLLISEA